MDGLTVEDSTTCLHFFIEDTENSGYKNVLKTTLKGRVTFWRQSRRPEVITKAKPLWASERKTEHGDMFLGTVSMAGVEKSHQRNVSIIVCTAQSQLVQQKSETDSTKGIFFPFPGLLIFSSHPFMGECFHMYSNTRTL